jgi:hypothetical protein
MLQNFSKILDSLSLAYPKTDSLKKEFGIISVPEKAFLINERRDYDSIYLIYHNNKFKLYSYNKTYHYIYALSKKNEEDIYSNIISKCPSFIYFMNNNFICWEMEHIPGIIKNNQGFSFSK